jgi:drug/metabolite transporter (DMT)-like permease
VVAGTICGLISAVAYTAANLCLRAVANCDPVWVSCLKSVPTIVLVAPWLLILAGRGERILPPPRLLALIAAAGACGQLAGNVSFQWSLGIIGVAVAVSLTLGTMILSAAVLGRLLLHEPVTPRTAFSIVLLLAAIAALSLGAGEAHRSVTDADNSGIVQPAAPRTGPSPAASGTSHLLLISAGVAAALASGIAYTILGVAIRYAAGRGAPQPTTLMTVALVGLVSLGALSLARIGPRAMLETSPRDLWVMLAAGVFNAAAFVALTKALHLTSVVYVNVLNAAQAAMAAVSGAILFQEALSPGLLCGVALTIVGLLVMRGRKRVAAATATASPTGANASLPECAEP